MTHQTSVLLVNSMKEVIGRAHSIIIFCYGILKSEIDLLHNDIYDYK